MAYSKEIFSCIQEFVKSQNWSNKTDEETGHIMVLIRAGKKIETVELHLYAQEHRFATYIDYRLQVGEDAREQMLELLNRINVVIRYGNYELQTDTQTVRYRYAMDCLGQTPSLVMISDSVKTAFEMVRKCADAIADVAAGEATAKEAIEAAMA